MFSTVRISTSDGAGSGESIGTGFVLAADLGDGLNRAWLLISNKHVFGDTNQTLALNFHAMNSEGNGPVLGQVVVHVSDGFGDGHIEHPNVDLACLNISSARYANPAVFFKHLYEQHFASLEEPKLLPGLPVWFVGYPEDRFDTIHNLPLLRSGVIASYPAVDFNGNPHIVIDAQVYPGSSGSPVIADLNDEPKLIGVVSETMIRNQRLEPVTSNVDSVQQVIGLGIIIKVSEVRRLVQIAKDRILEAHRAEQRCSN